MRQTGAMILLGALIAACGSSDSAGGTTTQPAEANPPEATSTTTTSLVTTTTTTLPEPPGWDAVVLRGDGLTDARFGDDIQATREHVEGLLGPADVSAEIVTEFDLNAYEYPGGWEDCWGELCLYFGDLESGATVFVGWTLHSTWSYASDLERVPVGPASTGEGLTVGTTYAETLALFPGDAIVDDSLANSLVLTIETSTGEVGGTVNTHFENRDPDSQFYTLWAGEFVGKFT